MATKEILRVTQTKLVYRPAKCVCRISPSPTYSWFMHISLTVNPIESNCFSLLMASIHPCFQSFHISPYPRLGSLIKFISLCWFFPSHQLIIFDALGSWDDPWSSPTMTNAAESDSSFCIIVAFPLDTRVRPPWTLSRVCLNTACPAETLVTPHAHNFIYFAPYYWPLTNSK